MSFAIGVKVLSWVLPIVIGPLVYLAARGLLNAHAVVDAFPPIAKRMAVIALGFVVAGVFQVLGLGLPAECVDAAHGGGLTDACTGVLTGNSTVQAVTGALVAMFLHQLKKSNPRT